MEAGEHAGSKIIILAHRGAQLLFTYIQLVRARARFCLIILLEERERRSTHETARLKLKEEDEKKAICLYISKL